MSPPVDQIRKGTHDWDFDTTPQVATLSVRDPAWDVILAEAPMPVRTIGISYARRIYASAATRGMIDTTHRPLPVISIVPSVPASDMPDGLSCAGFETDLADGALAVDLIIGNVATAGAQLYNYCQLTRGPRLMPVDTFDEFHQKDTRTVE